MKQNKRLSALFSRPAFDFVRAIALRLVLDDGDLETQLGEGGSYHRNVVVRIDQREIFEIGGKREKRSKGQTDYGQDVFTARGDRVL